MSCRICQRSSCTESFHSLEEQDRFEQREAMTDDVFKLRHMLQEAQDEITELNAKIEELDRLYEANHG